MLTHLLLLVSPQRDEGCLNGRLNEMKGYQGLLLPTMSQQGQFNDSMNLGLLISLCISVYSVCIGG
jgi:hypothetical protein